LEKTGCPGICQINPWKGFFCPNDYAKMARIGVEATQIFTLKEKSVENTSLTFSMVDSNSELTGVIHKKHDHKKIYPLSLVVKRWNNKSGLHVGLGLKKQLTHEPKEIGEIMKNIPGAVPGTFMQMQNKETNESRLFDDHNPNVGAAFLPKEYGTLNKQFLSAFGPIQQEDLLHGIIELPVEVVEKANLDQVFADLAEDYPIHSNSNLKKKGDNKEEEEYSSDSDDNNGGLKEMKCYDCDNAQIPVDLLDSYFLLPCDGLVAWPIPDNAEERADSRIHALQLRARSKMSKEIVKLYWIINGASLRPLIANCCELLIDPVSSVSSIDIGINVYPFKTTKWDDQFEIQDFAIESSKEEVLNKKRSVYLKYYVTYIVFPPELHEQTNMCTKLPENWPIFKSFQQDVGLSLNALTINENKRVH